MHNRCFSHESIVNPLVIDCRRFGPAIGAVMAENVFLANPRDGPGVCDGVSTDGLKLVNIGFTRKL
ncbi:MAG TPA: hypothetical protein VN943_03395 [Candidatus Acidoferrum sp.]|nr:hypothetical protein [Candidatus Acidoferrum sp.]